MKRMLLIAFLILLGLTFLWHSALTIERLSGLRGLAQILHLPADFSTHAGAQIPLNNKAEKFEANFEFAPKYTGYYQVLVVPVAGKYGAAVDAKSVLTCQANGTGFEARGDSGRVELDRSLNLGLAGTMLTFKTDQAAAVGVSYQCRITIQSSQGVFQPQHAYVRKITDI